MPVTEQHDRIRAAGCGKAQASTVARPEVARRRHDPAGRLRALLVALVSPVASPRAPRTVRHDANVHPYRHVGARPTPARPPQVTVAEHRKADLSAPTGVTEMLIAG
jgi:hypothetical protein